MDRPPRLGFVGAGMMAQLAHLPCFSRLRDEGLCELVALTDRREDVAAEVAGRFRIGETSPSAEAVFQDDRIDAVVAITPWSAHVDMARLAASAGKPLMTEKPLCGRVDEAEEAARVVDEAGVVHKIGYMKTHDPGAEFAGELLRELMASDELGKLHSIDTVHRGGDWMRTSEEPFGSESYTWEPPGERKMPDFVDSDARRYATFFCIDVYSHNLNLIRTLVGEPFACTNALIRPGRSMVAVGHIGEATASIRSESSGRHKWEDLYKFCFVKGEVELSMPAHLDRGGVGVVRYTRRDRGVSACTTYDVPAEWSFFAQAKQFVRSLRGEVEVTNPSRDCVADVRSALGIAEVAELAPIIPRERKS